MIIKKLCNSKELRIYVPEANVGLGLPLFGTRISAGFPSPADDYMEITLDLNDHLIKNPSSTFFAQITGTSMLHSGIYDNDIVIVDKSLQPKDDSILVCTIDGEFTLKRFKKIDEETAYLMPDNPDYEPILINKHNAFQIWGVVTYSIHKHY